MIRLSTLSICVGFVLLSLISAPASAGFAVKFIVGGWIGPTEQDRWCAQLDSDPALEFVVLHLGSRNVSIYDGATGAIEFQAAFDADYPKDGSCTILDVDGDGLLEVLVRATWPDTPASQTMAIDTDAVISVSDLPTPAGHLGQNAPNPFNPTTEIRFALPNTAVADLRIYDAAGRLVRTLAGGSFDAGDHAVRWDGRGEGGEDLAAGIYYYELTTAAGKQSKKAVLLK